MEWFVEGKKAPTVAAESGALAGAAFNVSNFGARANMR